MCPKSLYLFIVRTLYYFLTFKHKETHDKNAKSCFHFSSFKNSYKKTNIKNKFWCRLCSDVFKNAQLKALCRTHTAKKRFFQIHNSKDFAERTLLINDFSKYTTPRTLQTERTLLKNYFSKYTTPRTLQNAHG
jgi:hypothetical protein